MTQVIIENPVLNSPYIEPTRHFKFSDEGITSEIVESRRISSYFIPIAKPKAKTRGKQLALDTGWTQDPKPGRWLLKSMITMIKLMIVKYTNGNMRKSTTNLMGYTSIFSINIFLGKLGTGPISVLKNSWTKDIVYNVLPEILSG
jgi:hypothetical protein